jgi:hypothetical protein
MGMFGLKIHVYIHHALVDRFGRELNAFVLLDLTLMGRCVCSALMVKNGMLLNRLVHVIQDINGMASIVIYRQVVLLVECGMQVINNVYVLVVIIGVGIVV